MDDMNPGPQKLQSTEAATSVFILLFAASSLRIKLQLEKHTMITHTDTCKRVVLNHLQQILLQSFTASHCWRQTVCVSVTNRMKNINNCAATWIIHLNLFPSRWSAAQITHTHTHTQTDVLTITFVALLTVTSGSALRGRTWFWMNLLDESDCLFFFWIVSMTTAADFPAASWSLSGYVVFHNNHVLTNQCVVL